MTDSNTPIEPAAGDPFAVADMAWELAKQRMEHQKDNLSAKLQQKSSDQVIATQQALIDKLKTDLAATRKENDAFSAQLTSLESNLSEVRAQTEQLRDVNERLGNVDQSLSGVDKSLSHFNERLDQLTTQTQQITSDAEATLSYRGYPSCARRHRQAVEAPGSPSQQ